MKKLFRGLIPLLVILICNLSAFFPLSGNNATFCDVKIHTAQATDSSPVPNAGAYACILSDDVYFYTNTEGRRGLFLLPKSYYVRLIEYRPDYCKVEYQTDDSAKRLVGYVATEKLTFVDYTPARPYLYYVFDLRYKIEDADQTDSAFLTEITISCVYRRKFWTRISRQKRFSLCAPASFARQRERLSHICPVKR